MSYEWEDSAFDLCPRSYKLKKRAQPPNPGDDAPLLLSVWHSYVESLRLPTATQNGHYHSIGNLIRKHNLKTSDVICIVD